MSNILYQHFVVQSFVKTGWKQASSVSCEFLRWTRWNRVTYQPKQTECPWESQQLFVYISPHACRFSSSSICFLSLFQTLNLSLMARSCAVNGAWPRPLQKLQSHLWNGPCSSATRCHLHHDNCCCSHSRESVTTWEPLPPQSLLFLPLLLKHFPSSPSGRTGGRTDSFWHLYICSSGTKGCCRIQRRSRGEKSLLSAPRKPLCSLQR